VNASGGTVSNLTVVLRIENTGQAPTGIALIGPPPSAVATDGTPLNFDQRSVGGVGVCFNISPEAFHNCLNPRTGYLPPERYTRIGPGAAASATLRFHGRPAAEAGVLAFQAAFAVRRFDASQSQNQADQAPSTFSIGLSDLPIPMRR
jgi:hypothetical protein